MALFGKVKNEQVEKIAMLEGAIKAALPEWDFDCESIQDLIEQRATALANEQIDARVEKALALAEEDFDARLEDGIAKALAESHAESLEEIAIAKAEIEAAQAALDAKSAELEISIANKASELLSESGVAPLPQLDKSQDNKEFLASLSPIERLKESIKNELSK